jgi:pyridoxal phosphate enzyme (YggS family)
VSEALRARLALVRATLADACRSSGRSVEAVRLVAVSKRHGPEAIRAAYAAGQRDFGENYVQELVDKARALADLPELRWHFIGRLQSNKLGLLLSLASPCTLHTLDSARLAEALQRKLAAQAAQQTTQNARLDVLVQVNLGDEPQKAGVRAEELPQLLATVRGCDRLALRGLMLMPPATDDAEQTRPYFRQLAALAEEHGLSELSMGMSSDAAVAVQEGATLVRVGTAIFGAR